MDKLRNMWNQTVDELLNKVTWPTWDELRESAIVVLFASLIFAILIYILDIGIGELFNIFYSFFN
jgi:preprotein translocase subunit SecE